MQLVIMSIGKFSDTIPQNRRCSSVHRENWRVCWAPSSEILTVIQTPRNLLTYFTRILSRLKASMECTRWAMFFWHFLLHSQSTPISRPWLQHRSRSSTWLWSNTACPGLQPKWWEMRWRKLKTTNCPSPWHKILSGLHVTLLWHPL